MVAMVVLSVHTSFPAQYTTPVDSNVRYVLCAGPLGRWASANWESIWEALESLRPANSGGTEKNLGYRIAAELLEVPAYESLSALESEIGHGLETLRLVFNGISRELLENRAEAETYDREAAVYELFRLVSQREKIEEALVGIQRLAPTSTAVLLVLRNPCTQTGFMALKVPSVDHPQGLQLSFVSSQVATMSFLKAQRFEDTDTTERESFDWPGTERHVVRVCPAGESNGVLWVSFPSRMRWILCGRLRGRAIRRQLAGSLLLLSGDKDLILSRLRAARKRAQHHDRHELADIASGPEFRQKRALRKLFSTSQPLIGFSHIRYYRPRLYQPDSTGGVSGEPYEWWPEPRDHKLCPYRIDAEAFVALFDERKPTLNPDGLSACFPVVGGNRTLGCPVPQWC